jgi:hypothetical protein
MQEDFRIAFYIFYVFFAKAVTVDQLVVDTAPFLGKVSMVSITTLRSV